ncbi:MAG: ThuA domain-containing protein [Bryobacteraceae bacterium]
MLRILMAALSAVSLFAADRRITLIGGPPSHGPLAHEQNAAAMLLAKWLNRVRGIKATAYRNGWPAEGDAIDKADAVFVFCDGSERHLLFQEQRAGQIQKAAARGAGIMLYHYAVEPPAQRGHEETLDWIGGFFELNYSVNPIWEADIRELPKHPIASGVKPFRLKDEWYFNMRFREGMHGVTPILNAIPPAETTTRPDGIRSGNPDVRSKSGQPQVLEWAYERAGGGRGVGFTGGHFHLNLGDPNFRKVVLNSLVWVAKAKVPKNGVEVEVSQGELMENLDPKPEPKKR